MKNFLYVLEDGSVRLGPKPTDADIENIENGELLQIVDMRRKVQYVPGDGWTDIEQMDVDIDEEAYEDEEYDD